MKVTATLLLSAAAFASAEEASLTASVKNMMLARMGVGGATNCEYKCANLFNINQIWNTANSGQLNGLGPGSPSAVLNEYIGCVAGCGKCNGGVNDNCQKECKNKNWYNTNWYYNPYSGVMREVDCGVDDLLEQQRKCIESAGVPYTGGRAKLKKKYTKKTTKCYNHATYGIVAINTACNAKCKSEATCTVFDDTTQTCNSGTSLAEQYTAGMCGAGVLKNIIEPDKACIFGCVQNLCQKGADCMGNSPWVPQNKYVACQVITPQAAGEKYTIVPQIFNDNDNTDIATCCTNTRTCCSYKEGWLLNDNGRQRSGVCQVASEYCANEATSAFNPKELPKMPTVGAYPGDACNELWKAGGMCENAGLTPCPECRNQ